MRKIFKKTLCIAVFLLCALMLFSCGEEAVEEGRMTAKLVLSGKEIKITAAFSAEVAESNRDKMLYLFELVPGNDINDIQKLSPIAQANFGSTVSFTVPFSDGGAQRIASGFVVAVFDGARNTYETVNDCVAYIANPEELAINRDEYPQTHSIKGVYAENLTDAVTLGVSHAVVDLAIEDYLLLSGSASSVSHNFGGESYYFDRDAVELLDKKIKSYSELGINIYLRVYLGSAYSELDEGYRVLSYPSTEKGRRYYSINVNDPTAAKAFGAFVDLITERYTRKDKLYGFAPSLILGRGENSAHLGNSQSELLAGEYVKDYAVAARMAYNILLSNYANGRFYISTDKYFSSSRGAEHMSATNFLTAFSGEARRQGDYAWNLSTELSAPVATNDRIWYDTENTAVLTPNNLSDLTSGLLSREEFLFEGDTRCVAVSDFELYCHKESEASEFNQAASYAYAYYRAAADGKIEALIYSTVCDTENASTGLRSKNAPKDIYDIVRTIDTDRELPEGFSTLIGAAWSTLYEDRELRDKVERGRSSSGTAAIGDREKYKIDTLFGFDDGTLMGFSAVSGGYVGLVREENSSRLKAELTATDGMPVGIICGGIDERSLAGQYLIVPLRISSSDPTVRTFTLTLSLLQNGDQIRNYTSSLDIAGGEYATAIFNISDFTASKLGTDVALLLSVNAEKSADITLFIDEILTGKEPDNIVLTVVLIVLGVLAVGALMTVFIIWFRKHYTIDFGRSDDKNDKKESQKSEDRIEEALKENKEEKKEEQKK